MRGFTCGHIEVYGVCTCDNHITDKNWVHCLKLAYDITQIEDCACNSCSPNPRDDPKAGVVSGCSPVVPSHPGCAGVGARSRCGHTNQWLIRRCGEKSHGAWLDCPLLSLATDYSYTFMYFECAQCAARLQTPPAAENLLAWRRSKAWSPPGAVLRASQLWIFQDCRSEVSSMSLTARFPPWSWMPKRPPGIRRSMLRSFPCIPSRSLKHGSMTLIEMWRALFETLCRDPGVTQEGRWIRAIEIQVCIIELFRLRATLILYSV